jgi:thioredoxin 1
MKRSTLFSLVLVVAATFVCSGINAKPITIPLSEAENAKTFVIKTGSPIDLSNIPGVSSQEAFAAITKNCPTIVDFNAEWCGPCKQLNPTLQVIAANNQDIVVLKVNIDHHPHIANRFNFRGIPALFFFNDGVEVYRASGALDKKTLMNLIDKYLLKHIQ